MLGPYPDERRGTFYNVILDGSGGRRTVSYETREKAEAGVKRLAVTLPSETLTVEEALVKYRAALRATRRSPRTVKVYESAVLSLLEAVRPLRDVTTGYLRRRVETRRVETRKTRAKTEKTRKAAPRAVSVDTIATELRASKTFLRWCHENGHLVKLPELGKVKVAGARSAGKDQLTADEARRYIDKIIPAANKGDEGAIAAAAMLYLGVRSRELLDREVRDLDQGGTMLVIWRGKTKRARRRVEVPEPLRSWLLARARGRVGRALLFGDEDPDTGRWVPRSSSWLAKQVRRWCDAAKVPAVCPHGLRGTHSSLAEEAGATPRLVAAALGHASTEVASRHYSTPESRALGRQRRALGVLEGGLSDGNSANPSDSEKDQQET